MPSGVVLPTAPGGGFNSPVRTGDAGPGSLPPSRASRRAIVAARSRLLRGLRTRRKRKPRNHSCVQETAPGQTGRQCAEQLKESGRRPRLRGHCRRLRGATPEVQSAANRALGPARQKWLLSAPAVVARGPHTSRRKFDRLQFFADALGKSVCPKTKTGTSAPSARPISCRRQRGKSSCQRWLSASSTVAASELPPPRPPPSGRRFSMLISTPARQRRLRLQQPSSTHGQILLRHYSRQRRVRCIKPSARGEKRNRSPCPRKRNTRLQQVVTIGTSADDVQEEVEFGWRRIDAVPAPLRRLAVMVRVRPAVRQVAAATDRCAGAVQNRLPLDKQAAGQCLRVIAVVVVVDPPVLVTQGSGRPKASRTILP
jgi:hypothetical protein